PTPKTVWVRELTRCAHFSQLHTRSRMAARICDLPEIVLDICAPAGGEFWVTPGMVVVKTDCNCCSAFFDAWGTRSFVSRIFSSVAMTISRAGCIILLR